MTWTIEPGQQGDAVVVELTPAGFDATYTFYVPAAASGSLRIPDIPPAAAYLALDGSNGAPAPWKAGAADFDDLNATTFGDSWLFAPASDPPLYSLAYSTKTTPTP